MNSGIKQTSPTLLYLKGKKSTSALPSPLGRKGKVYSHSLKATTKEAHIPVLSRITLIHLTFLSWQEGHSKGITLRSNKAFQKAKGIHKKLFSEGKKNKPQISWMNKL